MLYITAWDVMKYGATPGCRGCEAVIRGKKFSRHHTEECRARMNREMEQADQDRIRKVNERREQTNRHSEQESKREKGGEPSSGSGI